jgi:epoxyqueuosine reductase
VLRVSADHLESVAQRNGLGLIGVLTLDQASCFLGTHKTYLEEWQDLGYAGEMRYMLRAAELFCDLNALLPGVRSLVSFSVPYCSSEPESSSPVLPPGFGRVARYAWGRDYHRILKRRLNKVVGELVADSFDSGEPKWRVFSDAVPLLERALAEGANLGFIGRNSMLIQPRVGSYTFVCEVLLNVEIEELSKLGQRLGVSSRGSCGSCSQCLSGCPTDAIVSSRVVDARRCISYLTIEKKTIFSAWERRAIGDWVFGCDHCQEVCPFNHRDVISSRIAEFSPEAGCGAQLYLPELLEIRTKEAFLARFQGTAIMRAGRECLLRNACCVLGNRKCLEASEQLIEALEEDESEMVRVHSRAILEEFLDLADGSQRRRIRSALMVE